LKEIEPKGQLDFLDDSFLAFVWDYLISLGNLKEVFRYTNNRLSKREKRAYLDSHEGLVPTSLLQNVFEYTKDWIADYVRINHRGRTERVSEVSYHPRYGWIVVSDRGGKSFIGRLSLALTDVCDFSIGHRTYFSSDWLLYGSGEITIGSYTSIGPDLEFRIQSGHDMQYPCISNLELEERSKDDLNLRLDIDPLFCENESRVVIGNDVWIGRNVVICADVEIQDGSVIGERSLVLKGTKTEPYAIYAGIPAKKVGCRFPEPVVAELLEIQWWNWTTEKIRENEKLFSTNLCETGQMPKTLVR
jgi:acetyltransferase-like isoleucine patch superfamily enzyme